MNSQDAVKKSLDSDMVIQLLSGGGSILEAIVSGARLLIPRDSDALTISPELFIELKQSEIIESTGRCTGYPYLHGKCWGYQLRKKLLAQME